MHKNSFCGVTYLPLSEATTLSKTNPFWTAIFGAFILRERYTCVDFLTSVFSFFGILLICKPAFLMHYLGYATTSASISYENHMIGICFSLTSAMCGSVV